jgi:hypothetical protein
MLLVLAFVVRKPVAPAREHRRRPGHFVASVEHAACFLEIAPLKKVRVL